MPFKTINDVLRIDEDGNIVHVDGIPVAEYLREQGYAPGDHINVVKHDVLKVVNEQASAPFTWCA